jgi:cysteinyl-tRNA synthetase
MTHHRIVQHELGCVALAQKRYQKAKELLDEEWLILDELAETLNQHNRLYHAKLTCLTWLRKCAKELGDDAEVRKLTEARASLKKKHQLKGGHECICPKTLALQQKTLHCRLLVRQYALAKDKSAEALQELEHVLTDFSRAIHASPNGLLREAAEQFRRKVCAVLSTSQPCSGLLKACDELRDGLRALGVSVNDSIQSKGCEASS